MLSVGRSGCIIRPSGDDVALLQRHAACGELAIGVDNLDRGKFKISSSSVIGTNDRFVIDGSGAIGIGTRAVLSSDAVTMRDPSGLKAAEFTPPSWRSTAISLAVAASQMRAVRPFRKLMSFDTESLSSDAVTMRDPSTLKAAELTGPSWPRRTAISLAVAASQMQAVLSSDQFLTLLGRVATEADQPGLRRVQRQFERAHSFLQVVQESLRPGASPVSKPHHSRLG